MQPICILYSAELGKTGFASPRSKFPQWAIIYQGKSLNRSEKLLISGKSLAFI